MNLMLNKKEVQHIAKLARLGLTENEITKYQKELSGILEHMEKLKELDISGVEPVSHSVLVDNVTRKDTEGEEQKTPNLKLTELMPETKNGYLKVKSILK
jgi:aspartyl-tRNA(Asn)/glutamyl-tRNA(Gln) amidotransferase subunit C